MTELNEPIEKPADEQNVTPDDNGWPPTPKEWLGTFLAGLWVILGFTLLFSDAYRALQLYSDLLAAIVLLMVPFGAAAITWWLDPRHCVDRVFELKK